MPVMDLFASRANFQIKPLVSWHPDPESYAIDAYTIKWDKAFLPFSQILRGIQKLMRDEAEILLVIPNWPTACWYLLMLRLLVMEPLVLPKGNAVLRLPHSDKLHPLCNKLQLLGVRLSGKPCRQKDFKATFVR